MGRIICVLCFLLTVSYSVNGQLNLKIGFESAYLSSVQNRAAVASFNQSNSTTLAQGEIMPELNYLNGLTLGLVYKFKYSRISANWHSVARRREAFGEIAGTPPVSFERNVRYRVSGVNLMYEFSYDRFSLGIGPGRDAFQMTSLIAGSSNNKRILNEEVYYLKTKLAFRLMETKRVSIYVEPYYVYLLNDVNHKEEFVFLDVEQPAGGAIDRPHYFGVQVLFYNGIQ